MAWTQKTYSSPRFHGNENRLEPHLVAISAPVKRGRKKFMSEGEKDKYFFQCKAERKWSRVTLERGEALLRLSRNLHSASASSSVYAKMRLQQAAVWL